MDFLLDSDFFYIIVIGKGSFGFGTFTLGLKWHQHTVHYDQLISELYFASFCFREAISAVCERRGVDVDSINVYLEQSRTPLPLLTTETAWLGGRHIRIRGKKTVTLITHSVS